jgi:hypothetical protein
VNGLTNESENALPLDESFWDHWHHSKVGIGIPVSEDKTMNVLAVLEDIYYTVDQDTEETKRLIIMMAAILLASKDDQADAVWQEMVISESIINMDQGLQEMLNEKP